MAEKLEHYLKAWALADPQPLAYTATSHVYTVTFEGSRVVLKVLTENGDEERVGAAALRYFDGHGAVRLLRGDDNTHLLEYADGDDLTGRVDAGQDEQATAIIAEVLNKLHSVTHQPYPTPLYPLKRWFRELFQKAEEDRASGIESIYRRAAPLAEKLLNDPREVRVLHGDMHHENIRWCAGRGWLAFDPKGLLGERTFDAANTLRNPWNRIDLVHNEARLLHTAAILAKDMKLDLPRLLAYTFVYACLSASWMVHSGDPAHDLRTAEIIEPHLNA